MPIPEIDEPFADQVAQFTSSLPVVLTLKQLTQLVVSAIDWGRAHPEGELNATQNSG